VIDRLHKLRLPLPAMAQETADARREAARLRAENSRLVRRLSELDFGHRVAPRALTLDRKGDLGRRLA